jgi:hypothetical protein
VPAATGGAPDIPGVSLQLAMLQRAMSSSSMVLFEIDPQRPPIVPLESDAPWAVHMDRIPPWPRTAQRVEVEAGLIERLKARRFVDCTQTDECPAVQIGSHAGAFTGLEQFPQATVPKTLDHQCQM